MLPLRRIRKCAALVALGGLLSLAPSPVAGQTEFIRGDANGDAASNPIPVNIADAVFILGYLFSSGPAPSCLQSADANDDEGVDLGDTVHILAGLFSGGPAPSAPFPDCGVDPTPGQLECADYAPCDANPPVLQFPGLTHVGPNAQGYQEYTLDLDPSVVFIYIPGGTFEMGQVGIAEPVHLVTLSPYLISKYEITAAQYTNFLDQTAFPLPPNPGAHPGFPGDYFTNPLYADHPAILLSWDVLNAAGGFLEWAGLSLPTEAQWEFAARGAAATTYPWGEDAPDAGGIYRANGCWGFPNSSCPGDDGWAYTNPVDVVDFSAFPGPFGTYGQSGNVWEMCHDWSGPYSAEPQTDPTGPATGTYRVGRGASWFDDVVLPPSAHRGGGGPEVYGWPLGFRPVRVIP